MIGFEFTRMFDSYKISRIVARHNQHHRSKQEAPTCGASTCITEEKMSCTPRPKWHSTDGTSNIERDLVEAFNCGACVCSIARCNISSSHRQHGTMTARVEGVRRRTWQKQIACLCAASVDRSFELNQHTPLVLSVGSGWPGLREYNVVPRQHCFTKHSLYSINMSTGIYCT